MDFFSTARCGRLAALAVLVESEFAKLNFLRMVGQTYTGASLAAAVKLNHDEVSEYKTRLALVRPIQ